MASSTSLSGSPEQPSVFKNTFHHGQSFKTLNTMRQQRVLCDVTVRVGDKEILGNVVFIIATLKIIRNLLLCEVLIIFFSNFQ